MVEEIPRSRQARLAAEAALVRVVHHYGGRPEFVVLGGLVPELLCSESTFRHAGTTDVDVQVNLEMPIIQRQSGHVSSAATNRPLAHIASRGRRRRDSDERVAPVIGTDRASVSQDHLGHNEVTGDPQGHDLLDRDPGTRRGAGAAGPVLGDVEYWTSISGAHHAAVPDGAAYQ